MLKKIIVCVIFLMCLTGCANGSQEKEYRKVDSEEAMQLMNTEKDYIILDVRTQAEYEEGHIPEAICIPNETIGTGEIEQLPDKKQMILVYCRSGSRSKQAASKLVKIGYENVVEFGGILDWTGEIVQE